MTDTDATATPILQLDGIVAGYHGNVVLHGVSVSVPPGSAVTILGPNGAGKSSLLAVASGLVRHRSGRVLLDGRDISSLPPHERARLGIAHVPEGRRIFRRQTVEENLLMGAYTCSKETAEAGFRWVYELFPVLERKRRDLAWTMSGGEQQMLAVAQAVMARPRVLLLDEPSAGLAPALVKQLFERVRRLNEEGISLLMVEQVVATALTVADYVYVISNGRVVAERPASEMEAEEIERRYLGVSF
jgi:branched-chain amino acid transport system ATP-binding protein